MRSGCEIRIPRTTTALGSAADATEPVLGFGVFAEAVRRREDGVRTEARGTALVLICEEQRCNSAAASTAKARYRSVRNVIE